MEKAIPHYNAFLMWDFCFAGGRWASLTPAGPMMEEALPQCKMLQRKRVNDLRLT
jgi:hypothetical protein